MIVAVNQFIQLRKEAWKKFRTSTGFEPVTSRFTGAMLYQLSYEATDRSIVGSYVPVKEMSVNDIWNKSYMNCGNEMKKMIVLLNTKKTEKKTKDKFDLQQIFMLGRCSSSPQ